MSDLKTSSPRIAIVGAGSGGIATAVNLKKAGIVTFEVFEQSDGAGGTWHDNNYPGCEVDIHSHMYSFSFMPYDWPQSHGDSATLKAYMEDTIDHFKVRDHFHFNTRVNSAVWDDTRSVYTLTFSDGSTREFDALVCALGILSNPQYPTWAGLEDFTGIKFHTSRWEHHHDLRDKVVAVVGTGSTSAQIVPGVAPYAKELLVFQQEPGWVVPKNEKTFSDEERQRYINSPLHRKWSRLKIFYGLALRSRNTQRVGTKANRTSHEAAIAYVQTAIKDPQVRAAVTPDFPFGCKRTVQASTYYETFNRENVHLVPFAVEAATPKGVVANGTEYEVDLLVMATGFQASNFLSTMTIKGVGGKDLHEYWSGDPKAFLGVTVPDFPNFFMIYGPNTNAGSIIYMNERASEMTVRLIKRLKRVKALDTRQSAFDRYIRWIDKMSTKHLAVQTQCMNYYYSKAGRNVTQFPSGLVIYSLLTKVLPLISFRKRA
jgi:cation diffusion facilitator CzcD-associated flavoprotein CzcO